MTQVIEAIRRTFTVRAPQERAFEVFTTGMGTWWPRDGHTFAQGEAVMEPRPGGRWYERAADGTEYDWGQVAEWQPPGRVLLLWQLDAEFTFDPDTAHATEVEVRFIAEGSGATRVEFEHRGFEVHGAAGEDMRAAVGGPEGWTQPLAAFERAV